MRTENITKLVERPVTVYIADDGTEFDTERQCRDYELDLRDELLAGIETCPDAECCPNFDGNECPENHNYFWYKPKNTTEIETIGKAYGIQLNESIAGQWICIEEGYDGDAWWSSLDEGIKYVNKLLDMLGYEMTITESEEETCLNE